MRRPSRVFKWFITIISALVFAVAAVFVFQPHLLRAFQEGFPSPVWPASGNFATVKGSETRLPEKLTASLTPRLLQLLSDSQARQLLVLYRGSVVIEQTVAGVSATDKFNSYSMVKSLVGALVFKAVSDGKIVSFKEPVSTYVSQLKGSRLGQVPISAFLDMKSGVLFEPKGVKAISVREPKDLQASFANPFGPMVQLHILGLGTIAADLGFDSKAQQKFNYQNVNTAILSAVLENAYGLGIEKILAQKIWQPAGAGTALWRRYAKDKPVSAYCCLYATARDWAKAARFLARNGSISKPFLPKQLWQKFFGVGLNANKLNKGIYANHVRYDILNRKGEDLQGRFAYFMGHNGQVVYLKPEQDLIVVRFGDKPQLLHSTLYEIWKSLNQN